MTKDSKDSKDSKDFKEKRFTPLDDSLYKKVVTEAKKKFAVWPSAYASGWVVRTYKARGGRYSSEYNKNIQSSLDRWYRQEWIDVCTFLKTGRFRECGRPHADDKDNKHYPYCRPRYRISKDTPQTIADIDKDTLKKRCHEKHVRPWKRIV